MIIPSPQLWLPERLRQRREDERLLRDRGGMSRRWMPGYPCCCKKKVICGTCEDNDMCIEMVTTGYECNGESWNAEPYCTSLAAGGIRYQAACETDWWGPEFDEIRPPELDWSWLHVVANLECKIVDGKAVWSLFVQTLHDINWDNDTKTHYYDVRWKNDGPIAIGAGGLPKAGQIAVEIDVIMNDDGDPHPTYHVTIPPVVVVTRGADCDGNPLP